MYKKPTIMTPEASVALRELISPIFLRKSKITGIEPTISITEKSINDTEIICLKSKDIFLTMSSSIFMRNYCNILNKTQGLSISSPY